MDETETISELRREVAGLRFGIFLGATVVMASFAFLNLIAVLSIPKFEKIFEDMLGSRDKLPELTKWVFVYGGWGGNLMPFVAISSFALITWSVMLLTRHSWRYILVAVFAVFGLILHGLVITMALYLPLIQIIQGIGSRP